VVDAELERPVPQGSPTTAITGVVDLDRFRLGSWRGRQRRSSGAHAIPGTGSVARVVGVRAMNPLLDRLEGELLGRGLVTRDSVDRWTDRHADEVGPRHGAQAVARVWGSGLHLDATAAAAAVLGRCACGRRWRYVPDTPTVRNVVLPGTPRCTGWRVLGAPPTRYREPDARTGRQVTFWSDDATTHHLVVPLRPIEARDAGPFELAFSSASRTAGPGESHTPALDERAVRQESAYDDSRAGAFNARIGGPSVVAPCLRPISSSTDSSGAPPVATMCAACSANMSSIPPGTARAMT